MFIATIRENGLDFGKFDEKFRLFLQDNQGRKVKVEIPKARRSDSQSRYYFAYLRIIAEETGNQPNDLHEYFKRTHLPPKFITVMGKDIKVPASTKELTKAEFGDYLDRICAEVNIPLPDPELAGYLPH